MEPNKQYSNMFYVAKAFGCLLVVLSHMPFGDRMPYEAIRMSIGQIGVFVYFTCAGFFFRPGISAGTFWKKKHASLIVPWLLFSTATFVISIMIGGSKSDLFLKYINWVLGIGSCYWFMPSLILCYVLFYQICSRSDLIEDILLYVCVGTSVMSVGLSICAVINYDQMFNQYTNVLNWIGVFALGVIIRKKGLIERICVAKNLIVALPLLMLFVFLSARRMVFFEAYIDQYSLPIEIIGVVCIYAVAKLLHNSNLLKDLGRMSYFIYLMHIQVAGMINTRLPYNGLFFVLRPVIALLLCYCIAKTAEWILLKMKWYDKFGSMIALR